MPPALLLTRLLVSSRSKPLRADLGYRILIADLYRTELTSHEHLHVDDNAKSRF